MTTKVLSAASSVPLATVRPGSYLPFERALGSFFTVFHPMDEFARVRVFFWHKAARLARCCAGEPTAVEFDISGALERFPVSMMGLSPYSEMKPCLPWSPLPFTSINEMSALLRLLPPPTISASYRTGRMTVMGIHHAPPNYSEDAFEAKRKTLVDSMMALPIAQKNFISFDPVRLDLDSLLLLYPYFSYLTTDIPEQSRNRTIEGPPPDRLSGSHSRPRHVVSTFL
jgi:hypothetical protein